MLRIFVSSVSRGLQPARSQIITALEKAGYNVDGMEKFGAQPAPPLEVCLNQVRLADAVVLVIGPGYGSLIPDGSISFTHAEFREARDRRIPVLAFDLRATETVSPEDAKGLADLRAEAGPKVTWQTIEAPSDKDWARTSLPAFVLAALTRARQSGNLGPIFNLFRDADRYFASSLEHSATKLSHRGALVGREDELGQLQSFLSSDQRLFILEAPGGIGKSRLLLEAARASPVIPLLFVDPQASWSKEHINEVPGGDAVLVFDDAHRRTDLDRFIDACLSRNPSLRFIVSCRPAATDHVRVLLRALNGADDTPVLRLQPLGAESAKKLAASELGAAFSHFAERLVKVADRNPLVIMVGAKCIREVRVPPEMLTSQPDSFRSIVLDHLLNDPGLDTEDAPKRRELLEIIAAVGPVRFDDKSLRAKLAGRLACPESTVARMLGDLDKHGFLLRRGGRARVTPDVLADHLLQSAAVDRGGEPTGFIDEMMTIFGQDHLSNLIGNAAELDWRLGPESHEAMVLAETWRRINAELPGLTHNARGELLKRLEPALRFAPRHLLELAERMVDEPAIPETLPDPFPQLGAIYGISGIVSPVFRICATHPNFASRCLRRLWRLAEQEAQSHPDRTNHAAQAIHHLLTYDGTGQWIDNRSTHAQAVELICQKVEADGQRQSFVWALKLLAHALKRTGETSHSSGVMFSWGSFSLTPHLEEIQARRLRAIQTLARVSVGNRADEAMSAIESLGELLLRPAGGLGQGLKTPEALQWLPEIAAAATSLQSAANGAHAEYTRYIARRHLREKRTASWMDARPTIVQALREATRVGSEALFDVIVRLPRDYTRHDYQRRRRLEQRYSDWVARRAWRQCQSAESVIENLASTLTSLAALGIKQVGTCHILVSSLCRVRPSETERLAALLRGPQLSDYLRSTIIFLHGQANIVACRRLIVECCADHDESTRVAGLDALQWLLHHEAPTPTDLELVRQHVNDTPWVIRLVGQVISRFRTAFSSGAIDTLLLVDWRDDPDIADRVLEVFDKAHGIDPVALSKAQFGEFLARVSRLPRLNGPGWQLERFVKYACEIDPIAVTAMLIERVQRADTMTDPDCFRFEPVPSTLNAKLPVPNQARLQCANMVRDASLRYDTGSDRWWPLLYLLICEQPGVAVNVLRPWLGTPDDERLITCAHLLKEFSHDVVYDEHHFISDLLIKADNFAPATRETVERLLYGWATGGSWQGTPGQPMPRDVEDARRATDCAQRYSEYDVVAGFYRSLEGAAQRRMERDRQRWEAEEID